MIRRLVSVVFLLGVVAAAVVMTGADDDGAKGKRYVIEFDNAFGLVEDGEVKIGGVSAGKIKDFDLTDSEPPKVAVGVEITEPGFKELTDNGNCAVRQQSLIGEYFIDCQLGDGKDLPEGGRIPVQRTNSTIPVDLVHNVQRRPYRERFRLILNELGTGLAGRPDELNEVIRRAHPGLRETTEVLRILADQREFIKRFVRDADRVSVAVEPNKKSLSRWAKEASEVAVVQASRRDSIAEQWRKLPAFLDELRPTVAQLQSTAEEQIPLLRRFRTAAPELQAFLAELGPFSEDSRRSFAALGNASDEGLRAVRESREEIAELRELSTDIGALAKPLRQFLQTLDDRDRSTEADPLAKTTAPPAPDKTAYTNDKQGFTGFEGVWNYVYYQTLSLNMYDEVSHLLRSINVQSPCSSYDVNPTPERQKLCGHGLGRYAPGVNDPDPTDDTRQASRLSAEENLKRYGTRRGAGQPEAPALPGQPDPSKPNVTLPPAVQEIIDGLRGAPSAGGPDASGGVNTDQLLDFLMAP